MPIFRRTNFIITASGIITLCKWLYSIPPESSLQSSGILYSRLKRVMIPDAVIIKCPPEDGHVDAGNMSRIIM
jgi:hypothetical protein